MRGHGLANRLGKPYPTTFRISVDRPGIEPGFPDCQPGVFPLDHQPVFVQWTAGESNPDCLGANQASSLWTSGPHYREVRPGVEPGLPPYHGGVLPKHLQTISSVTVIPDGVEPSLSWLSPRRLCLWTTESQVTGVGLEPTGTRLSTSPLCQFAYPVMAGPGVAPGGPGLWGPAEHWPTRSCRPRYRTGHTGLMGASWAPAAPAISNQGEIRTPKPCGTTF